MKPRDFKSAPYSRVVMPDEQGGYYAEVLEFPGCFAEGKTSEEAFRHLERAAEEWIADCLERGHDVPEPSSTKHYSGHYALRIPKSIHRRVAQVAMRENTSVNQLLISLISGGLELEDRTSKILNKIEERIAPLFARETTGFTVLSRENWNPISASTREALIISEAPLPMKRIEDR